jgi:hypothetical protein
MTTVRHLRASNALLVGVSVAIVFAAGTLVSAHRLDEYLQAARIDLQADGVTIELDVTPGAAVADSIIAAIDRDQDGAISTDEQHTYAGEIVRQLEIALDGAPLQPHLSSSTFPTLDALRHGEGTIRLQVSAAHRTLSMGLHQLFFSNRHLQQHSVYLANALVPTRSRLSVMEQQRTADQRQLTIDYSVSTALAGFSSSGLLLGLLATVLIVRYRQRRGA